MKTKDYLDLKMGIIEQYSKVIKKDQEKTLKQFGWKNYKEINLPEGDEEAFLIYGDINEDETLVFNIPKILTSSRQLIERKITGFSCNLGTYGMGGPGFFGLLLDDEEYLIYATWNASKYVFINDKVVESDLNSATPSNTWYSNTEDKVWDYLSKILKGSHIIECTYAHDECLIIASNGEKKICIKFIKNPEDKDLDITELLLFQDKNARLVVQ